MFLALALLALGPSVAQHTADKGAPRAGLVVVAAGALTFEESVARRVCADPARRLVLHIGPPESRAHDPFSALGTPTPSASIRSEDTYPGDDRDLAARVSAQSCIVLSGGTWIEWWSVLKPNQKLTRLGRALVEAHATGTTVIGFDAAGTYLAEWSVLSRAALKRPSRNPHDESRDILLGGLGLARGLCLDLATDGRDSPEPFLELVAATRIERAVWLGGTCAWIQDPAAHSATIAATDGAAFVFDLRATRRSRGALYGVGLTKITDGGQCALDARGPALADESNPERAVQNSATTTLKGWFAPPLPHNAGNFGKVLELRGERFVARLLFESAPRIGDVSSRSDAAVAARLDWIPLAR
ncbi:MAG: hypothetical protein JNL28_16145 [Planctomycetes bacterium]|nr:hypothetical protein [Planctomycetota bacterium]